MELFCGVNFIPMENRKLCDWPDVCLLLPAVWIPSFDSSTETALIQQLAVHRELDLTKSYFKLKTQKTTSSAVRPTQQHERSQRLLATEVISMR